MPWKDKEKARAAAARYREQNREARREAGRAYYAENKDRVLARQRQYIDENKEEISRKSAERYVRTKEKRAERLRARTPEKREADLEYQRRYREANRVRLAKKAREYYHKNRDRVLAADRRRKYGIEVEDFEALAARQKYSCGICETHLFDLPTRHIHIDHCHDTGEVRGILCHFCNAGLGHFKDDPDALRRAISYLEVNGVKPLDKPVG